MEPDFHMEFCESGESKKREKIFGCRQEEGRKKKVFFQMILMGTSDDDEDGDGRDDDSDIEGKKKMMGIGLLCVFVPLTLAIRMTAMISKRVNIVCYFHHYTKVFFNFHTFSSSLTFLNGV